MHRADTRIVRVAFARGLGRDELHKLQDGAKSGLSFSPPGAAAASATADRLRFSPANCTERTLALSVLRLRGGWGETSCTSSRTAQNLVCPFHRQVPRRQVPAADHSSLQPGKLHTADTRIVSVAFARGLGRDELLKLQDGAKSGLSSWRPRWRRQLLEQEVFVPAAIAQTQPLAVSVLRLRGGWGETSCTSSRKAQNLVCPFHRQVPRRQVPQLIEIFASARQAAQSGHSQLSSVAFARGLGRDELHKYLGRRKHLVCPSWRQRWRRQLLERDRHLFQLRICTQTSPYQCQCCVCAGAGARRAAQAPGRRKIWFVLSPPGAAAASATADRLRFSPARLHRADTRIVRVAFARGLGQDELHKLQEGAKSGLSFSPPGAADSKCPS